MPKRWNIIITIACIICLCGCENVTERQISAESNTVENHETPEINTDLNQSEESESDSDDVYSYDHDAGEGDCVNWNARVFMENVNVGWNLGNSLGTAAKECGYDANPEMETIG